MVAYGHLHGCPSVVFLECWQHITAVPLGVSTNCSTVGCRNLDKVPALEGPRAPQHFFLLFFSVVTNQAILWIGMNGTKFDTQA